jgi:hypothetical protein
VDRLRGDQVVVVEHKQARPIETAQLVGEGPGHHIGGRRRGRLQHRAGVIAYAGGRRVQGARNRAPEARRVVVPLVEGDPRRLRRSEPVREPEGEQRGLAEAGGGDHQHKAGGALEAADQLGAGHQAGGRRRWGKLGGEG